MYIYHISVLLPWIAYSLQKNSHQTKLFPWKPKKTDKNRDTDQYNILCA